MSVPPPPGSSERYVDVQPFEGGTITLPERFFVHPADPTAATTVPSLAFLITRQTTAADYAQSAFLKRLKFTPAPGPSETRPFHLMFDLGLRSSPERYMPIQQAHLEKRKPYNFSPGVAEALRIGPLTPHDIHAVILSHVHYDHHGDPEDFSDSSFFVGHGALAVVRDGLPGGASHQFFDPELFSHVAVQEFPPVGGAERADDEMQWKPLGAFPFTLDLFGDGSVYVVDMPGHLPGHLNLLCRVARDRYYLFVADACHDTRILTGEKQVGVWNTPEGHATCIHSDKALAEQSIQMIKQFSLDAGDKLEVVLAHDAAWARKNGEKFYPNKL